MPTFLDQTFQIFGYNSNFTMHFQTGFHDRVNSKKVTIMYAKLLWGTKMKTTGQGVTAPLIPPVGDAKTVTSSEFPAYRGTTIECIWGESPPNPPLRPEGCRGFKWLVHKLNATWVQVLHSGQSYRVLLPLNNIELVKQPGRTSR